ncbi:hypothetical protein SynBIOSE41_04354 [Synechococcus sp. BIOS-E4-1]|uniref:hypothetical protein n=1 Tax=Synechococcus sp. BIOS-E4-1 TaxID=1400864 RepID=UPI001647DA50|nr:hypothetical protein [Synechococcus sp. BIOS-E4-1]QNI56805.1 hypothetical protein SynBIOSE41_04354 [Synechococcus sp. BIOS-E4-1]
MPKITTTCVEMTCLQGLADLERLEGPWVERIAGGDPEGAMVILRLLLAHMASTSKRLWERCCSIGWMLKPMPWSEHLCGREILICKVVPLPETGPLSPFFGHT